MSFSFTSVSDGSHFASENKMYYCFNLKMMSQFVISCLQMLSQFSSSKYLPLQVKRLQFYLTQMTLQR